MSWRPDEADAWLYDTTAPRGPFAEPSRLLGEILHRIPDPGKKVLLDLDGSVAPFVAARFGRVLSSDEPPGSGRFDVAVAIDCIRGPFRSDVDRALTTIHDRLVEGGLFVGTFPALSSRGGPYALQVLPAPEAGSPPAFHEFELQYRLSRIGFQAVRIWRVGRHEEKPGRLLCRTVRRALN